MAALGRGAGAAARPLLCCCTLAACCGLLLGRRAAAAGAAAARAPYRDEGAVVKALIALEERLPEAMSYQNLRLEGKGEGINVLRIDPAQGGGLESKERTRVMLLFGAGTRQLVSAELALRLARRLADEIGGNDEVELAMGGESVSAGAQLSAMDIALVPVAHPAGYRAAWDDIKATWEGEASCEDEEMLSEGEEHEKVSESTRLMLAYARDFRPHMFVEVHGGEPSILLAGVQERSPGVGRARAESHVIGEAGDNDAAMLLLADELNAVYCDTRCAIRRARPADGQGAVLAAAMREHVLVPLSMSLGVYNSPLAAASRKKARAQAAKEARAQGLAEEEAAATMARAAREAETLVVDPLDPTCARLGASNPLDPAALEELLEHWSEALFVLMHRVPLHMHVGLARASSELADPDEVAADTASGRNRVTHPRTLAAQKRANEEHVMLMRAWGVLFSVFGAVLVVRLVLARWIGAAEEDAAGRKAV